MVKNKDIEERKFVSRLIYAVLTEQLCVREAILKFPKELKDKTLKAAYHALVHFEADEDLRRRDNLYKRQQDDYLEFIAQTLEKGENLPDNVIRSYEKFYKNVEPFHSEGMKGLIKNLCKFLNV